MGDGRLVWALVGLLPCLGMFAGYNFGVSRAYYSAREVCTRLASEYEDRCDEMWELREAVAELFVCAKSGGCASCHHADDCKIPDKMAELGIRVEVTKCTSGQ